MACPEFALRHFGAEVEQRYPILALLQLARCPRKLIGASRMESLTGMKQAKSVHPLAPQQETSRPWPTPRREVGGSGWRSNALWVAALVLVAGISFWLIWLSTELGIGLRGDSLAYIGGARSLVAGYGYSRISGGGEVVPINHFPPLYSTLLAGAGRLGADAIRASRVLNALLLGLNAVLLGILVARGTGKRTLGVLAAFLLGTNHVLVDVHSWAMAEPLYLSFLLTFLLALQSYLTRTRRQTLVLAAVLAGLSILVRYAGLALIVTGLLSLLAPVLDKRKRIADLGVFLAIGLAPPFAWFIRNLLLLGSMTNRTFTYHPPSVDAVRAGSWTMWFWTVPSKIFTRIEDRISLLTFATIVLFLAVFLILVLGWSRWRREAAVERRSSDPLALLVLLSLHFLVYSLLILANLLFYDASTPLDGRILSPLFLVLLALLGVGLSAMWNFGQALPRMAVIVMCVLFPLASVDDVIDVVRSAHAHGLGFSGRAWQESEIMAAVRQLPDVTIYTNEPDAVYFLSGRPSYIVLSQIDPVTRGEREDYDNWLRSAQGSLRKPDSVLVLFHVESLMADPWDREMVIVLTEGLACVQTYGDGSIYRASC